MMITRYCPQCGAEAMFDDSRESMFCSYCGARINSYPMKAVDLGADLMPQNSAPAYPQRSMQAATAENLTIDYSTSHQMYSLSVIIDGQQWIFPNGARKSFYLRQGAHILSFQIAGRLWNRRVYVPFEGSQVLINVVYAGRTKIYIYPPQ